MKTKIIIGLFAMASLGCVQKDTVMMKKLTTQIETLQIENKVLRDSLSNHQEQFLRSQILLGFQMIVF